MKPRAVEQLNDEKQPTGNVWPSIAEAERECGLKSGSIKQAIYKQNRGGGFYWRFADNGHAISAANDKPSKQKQADMNLAGSDDAFIDEIELNKRHNMLYKLRLAVEAIQDGQYFEEEAVLRQIGIYGKPGYRRAVDHPDMRKYRGKADGVYYFGHPAGIERNKQKGILS